MTVSPRPTSSAVYYTGNYWNNRPEVVEYMNDIADDLLDQARGGAATRGRPIEYRRVDSNTDDLVALGEFDLVVNHAAAHHIADIDRVLRQLCRLLPDDGVRRGLLLRRPIVARLPGARRAMRFAREIRNRG